MSETGFFELLKSYAKLKAEKFNQPPVADRYRYRNVPFNLAQDSLVEISSLPITRTQVEGGLIKDVPPRHLIAAVGKIMNGRDVTYNSYLSNLEGAFLTTSVVDGHPTDDVRLFVPYDQQHPATPADWDFWLASDFFLVASDSGHHFLATDAAGQPTWVTEETQAYRFQNRAEAATQASYYNGAVVVDRPGDGYIGYPIMQSKDSDGKKQYHRMWMPGEHRIQPQQLTEAILRPDAPNGEIVTVKHKQCMYGRHVTEGDTNSPIEYLLVSAVDAPRSASVNLWLGVDLETTDFTVLKPKPLVA